MVPTVSTKYGIIYSDPAWRFEPYARETGLGRAPDAHYETMTLPDMQALPVADCAADDAVLAMWVYDPMYPQAIELAAAWDFAYVTVLFRWLKTTEHPGQLALFPIEAPDPPWGLGYHTRAGGCEECWLFKRGNGFPVLRHDIQREFYAMVRDHSRKPDAVPGWIVDLYGDQLRAEMFARTRRDGWDTIFSNQADKFRTQQKMVK